MQFTHPELLYALFLLIVPIIVHFFQLRKFKQEQFTNVKFLQKVAAQTRNSSRLKKWLILFTRILALACLVFAFSQPFIPNNSKVLQKTQTVIYLDNSYSMQQRGEHGELLKNSIQELLENLPEDQPISLITNQKTFSHVRLKTLKKELPDLGYSSKNLSLKTAYLKAQTLFSKNKNQAHNFVAISDFQEINLKEIPGFKENSQNILIPVHGTKMNNLSIDSVSVENNGNTSELKVFLAAQKTTKENYPISLFNGKQLIAKTSTDFSRKKAEVRFSLPKKTMDKAKVSIKDQALSFDNSFYFSINPKKLVHIVTINGDSDIYLKKVFRNKNNFDFKSFSSNQTDFSQLKNADLVILNELSNLPNGLAPVLKENMKNGGFITLVPPTTMKTTTYNAFLQTLGLGRFSNNGQQNLKVTNINFSAPLYKNVFDKSVRNFQYPTVKTTYQYEPRKNTLLHFNNQQPFLLKDQQAYIFTAPLNAKNTNFKNSPLIVPTFYNMGLLSLQYPALYYTIGKSATFNIEWNLGKDEVVHLQNEQEDFIPIQHKFGGKLAITTKNLPKTAGNYQITAKNNVLNHLSFNNDRKENNLTEAVLDQLSHVQIDASIPAFFAEARNQNHIREFWKWFVIFALIFLVTEMLLLKFLK